MREKTKIIESIANKLLMDKTEDAISILDSEYKFSSPDERKRSYSDATKCKLFLRDGYVNRYTGERLINPGLLRTLTSLMPQEFPFQKNWKMSETHIAYWELMPTVDHIVPICRGGEDVLDNMATTSMLHNQIKANWSLDEMKWTLQPVGNLKE